MSLGAIRDLLLPTAHPLGIAINIEGDGLVVSKLNLAFAITHADIALDYYKERFVSGIKLLVMLTEYGALNADNPSNGTQTG